MSKMEEGPSMDVYTAGCLAFLAGFLVGFMVVALLIGYML